RWPCVRGRARWAAGLIPARDNTDSRQGWRKPAIHDFPRLHNSKIVGGRAWPHRHQDKRAPRNFPSPCGLGPRSGPRAGGGVVRFDPGTARTTPPPIPLAQGEGEFLLPGGRYPDAYGASPGTTPCALRLLPFLGYAPSRVKNFFPDAKWLGFMNRPKITAPFGATASCVFPAGRHTKFPAAHTPSSSCR